MRFHGQPNSLDQLLISVYNAKGYHDVRELLLADADIEVNETFLACVAAPQAFEIPRDLRSRLGENGL